MSELPPGSALAGTRPSSLLVGLLRRTPGRSAAGAQRHACRDRLSTETSDASRSRAVGKCSETKRGEHMYISIGAAILILILLIIFVF